MTMNPNLIRNDKLRKPGFKIGDWVITDRLARGPNPEIGTVVALYYLPDREFPTRSDLRQFYVGVEYVDGRISVYHSGDIKQFGDVLAAAQLRLNNLRRAFGRYQIYD